MKQRVHLFVSGQVQGVGYRHATLRTARVLGISGWVRNVADGRVEILASGQANDIDALIEWCRQGPPGAGVSGVEVVSRQETDLAVSSFEIWH